MIALKIAAGGCLLALPLAGCAGAPSPTAALPSAVERNSFFGGTGITPFEPSLAIGGIYTTTGTQKKLVPGVRIAQFCQRDTEGYAPRSSMSAPLAETYSAKLSGERLLDVGSITFPGLSIEGRLQRTYSAEYALTKVTRASLDEKEDQLADIKAKIGARCWQLIAEYRAMGRDVFILAEALHVEKVSVSLSSEREAGVGAQISAIGIPLGPKGTLGQSQERSITSNNVYVEVTGEPVSPPQIASR